MDYTSKENNNFNLIRLIAAYMVILAHSFAIQGVGIDPILALSHSTHSGEMAVYIFIFLSGIFATKSIIRSESAIVFIKKRLLRLYPELILCLIFVVIIGSIYTELPLKDYWGDIQTRKYFFKNILEIENEHFLLGVFLNHPYQGVNGVLWFITFQIRIYFTWALLKYLGIFKTVEKANLFLIILLVWISAFPNSVMFLGTDPMLYDNQDF